MLGWRALIVLGALSCGGQSDARDADSDSLVTAQQIDGVWVFTYAPRDYADVRGSGTVAISEGCLVVGTQLVVWPEQQLDDVRQYIEAAQRGAPPNLIFGGSEGMLDPLIRNNCGIRAVFFAQ